jgi:hypothetical protein
MKDDGISEYDELYNPENLLAIIRDLKERVQRLELKDVIAVELSEISDELGDIYGGTIINEEVPTTAAPDITADVALTIDTSTLLVTCSPSGGQRVPLLDTDLTFTTYYLTAAITYDASGLTKDKYIDWYIYFDTSVDPPVLKLYPSVWTNDTTRSEAQTTKSGVVFLASNVRKRFIAVGKIPTADDPWIGGTGDVSWGGLENGATAGHVAVFADKSGKIILDGGEDVPGVDGWMAVSDTWTYDSPTTITVPLGTIYEKGDKIRLVQAGNTKYFYIVSIATPAVTLTITGGSSYTLTNEAISSVFYSKAVSPPGFPHWFSYTPTGIAASNVTLSGMFCLVGWRCIVNILVEFTGGITFTTMPTLPIICYTPISFFGGPGYYLDFGTVESMNGIFSKIINGSDLLTLCAADGTLISATVPITWASGDKIYIMASYSIGY